MSLHLSFPVCSESSDRGPPSEARQSPFPKEFYRNRGWTAAWHVSIDRQQIRKLFRMRKRVSGRGEGPSRNDIRKILRCFEVWTPSPKSSLSHSQYLAALGPNTTTPCVRTSEEYASRGQVIGSTSDIYGKTEAFFPGPPSAAAAEKPAAREREREEGDAECRYRLRATEQNIEHSLCNQACFFLAS